MRVPNLLTIEHSWDMEGLVGRQASRVTTDILNIEAVTTFSSFRFSELSQPICSSPLLRISGKSASQMPSTAILQEVHRLYSVSDRLDSLAEQHPVVSEALLVISGSVRNTATLLEVLVATKIPPPPSAFDSAN